MGYMTEAQRHDYVTELNRKQRAANEKRAAQREEIAKKLVMVVTDSIVNDIVRPGPVPEERECYDMAHEVREHRPVLLELALAVLNAEHVAKLPPEVGENP